jgi:hypothetical protein
VRERLGLGVGEADGVEVASAGLSPRDFDGRSDFLPRSPSFFSLRSRVDDDDDEALGAGATSSTGDGATGCGVVMLRATVKPSACALSSKVVSVTGFNVVVGADSES